VHIINKEGELIGKASCTELQQLRFLNIMTMADDGRGPLLALFPHKSGRLAKGQLEVYNPRWRCYTCLSISFICKRTSVSISGNSALPTLFISKCMRIITVQANPTPGFLWPMQLHQRTFSPLSSTTTHTSSASSLHSTPQPFRRLPRAATPVSRGDCVLACRWHSRNLFAIPQFMSCTTNLQLTFWD
jgi:hypothetical protein